MNGHASLDKCLKYIDFRLRETLGGAPLSRPTTPLPSVTLSRQTGTGGIRLGEELARVLQEQVPGGGCDWTVFHKNLVERALEEHHLPRRFEEYMTEDRVSAITDAVEEMLGLHPSAGTLVWQTTETILHLAEMGHVILVGRGANVITARLPSVVHVRLIGTLERRVERIRKEQNLSQKAAQNFVTRQDRGRRRYLARYFKKEIDDPQLYHLVINTDQVTLQEAVDMIVVLVRAKVKTAGPKSGT